jgi:tetratricopeptide (TPR) repeat protein
MEPVSMRIIGSIQGSIPPVRTGIADVPPLDPAFTGRTTDLARLGEALRDAAVTVVSGLAGVGKTTLALKAARDFGGKILFLSLEGYDNPVEPTASLPHLLAALGVPQEDIPAEQVTRESLYRSTLDEQQEPVLVLLDNASSAAQVRSLLPGSTRHRVLVTSRHTLAELNARLIELDVLPVDEAIALVTTALLTRRPDDVREPTAELVGLADRLPLALSVIAAVLADDTTLSIGELTGLLSPPADRLDELEMPGGDDSVRRAFDLSYTRLSHDEQRMFRMLSVVPSAEFAAEHACVVVEGELRHVQRLLNSLRRAHLLEHGGTRDRFRTHDLLRLYAAERAAVECTASELDSSWDRLLTHSIDVSGEAGDRFAPLFDRNPSGTRFSRPQEATEWLDVNWPMLTNLVEKSYERGLHTQVLQLVVRLGQFIGLRAGWHGEWLHLHELSVRSARQLGDRRAEGLLTSRLGMLHQERNDLTTAERCYREAVQILLELGDSRAMCVALSNLATLDAEAGRLNLAEAAFNVILDFSLRAEHYLLASTTHYSLGGIAHKRGDPEAALDHLRQAGRICLAMGNAVGAAAALNYSGVVSSESGEHDRAHEAFKSVKRIAELTGDVRLQADATANLGATYILRNDNQAAVQAYQAATELFTQAGTQIEVDRIAKILADLGRTQPR